MGLALAESGAYADAIRAWRTAIDADASHADAHRNPAALAETGSLTEAAAVRRRGAELYTAQRGDAHDQDARSLAEWAEDAERQAQAEKRQDRGGRRSVAGGGGGGSGARGGGGSGARGGGAPPRVPRAAPRPSQAAAHQPRRRKEEHRVSAPAPRRLCRAPKAK